MNPRSAAHRILAEVRGGAFADQAAERILGRVEPADRGLALELAYGCLRLRARLDTWIRAFTDRPLRRMDAEVLDWLRIGTYQLKELRTPDHAAVNETVRMARSSMDPGRAGYINAVLRALAADERDDPFPRRDGEPLAYLSSWGSHPEWLVRRWLDRWSVHDVTRLVKHDNTAPDVVIRVFEDGTPTPPEGVEVSPITGWPRSYRLARGSPGEALAGMRAVIQDPAASAVVDYIGDELPEPVLDVCAAPGTKAIALAAEHAVRVTALDISRRRLKWVRGPAERVGVSVVQVVADARRLPIAEAGLVLADVPCTGTGVLRRRADARWRLEEDRLPELVEVQHEILEGCAEVVRPGGVLVYSTCSLESEENEDQVDAFLERHPEYERESPREVAIPESCISERGDLLVLPWLTGTDGAYAARLRRTR